MDTNALPDILRDIMASERFSEIMNSLRPTEEVSEPIETKEEKSPPTIPPEVLAKLPDVISALTGGTEDSEKITAKLPSVMNALAGANAKAENKPKKPPIIGGDAKRKALLRALRPYMNTERQSVIDNVIRFESMAEIMTALMGTSEITNRKGDI